MIRVAVFDQDFSYLSANSKDLSLTRNDFMERSNHMKALVILYFKE
ncbi:hypothetical protein GOM44_06165 [Wolbachia endosymbiont of Atemnus politus]|nr:hypothetical protein [Wolbachia endosymbiont of Atemnus politus]